MPKKRNRRAVDGVFVSALFRSFDFVIIFTSGVLAYFLRYGVNPISEKYLLVIGGASLIGTAQMSWIGAYEDPWDESGTIIERGVVGVGLVALTLVVLSVMLQENTAFSRLWMGYWFLLSLVSMVSWRLTIPHALAWLAGKGGFASRILVVGEGKLVETVFEKLVDRAYGVEMIGYVTADVAAGPWTGEGPKFLGDIDGVLPRLHEMGVDEVWIALPLQAEAKLKATIEKLGKCAVTVRYVPDIFALRLLGHTPAIVGGLPVIELNGTPMKGTARVVKESLDRLGALLMIGALIPVLVVIALGIRASSKGPILFKQLRRGWNGKPFTVYKFRTMHDEPCSVFRQARKGDPRVTRIGAVLRRTSLDELPQLFNVLRGEMSLVGPRPHPLELDAQYGDTVESYMQRNRVKPGMTGWAQVNGLRGEVEGKQDMIRRIEYDLYYIRNWSLFLDTKIILLTLAKGFVYVNAY